MAKNEIPRKEYPRPQFEREDWINLNGKWTYRFDFGKTGIERKWNEAKGFENDILVPFCPESELSGVGHTDFIEIMWYHRRIKIPESWEGKLILLNFGAVDFESEIFIDGGSAGRHWGGSASFSVDITELVKPGSEHDLVVFVRDELRSGEQPHGKQSNKAFSYGCLYTRTTGIWQTVWLEAVNPCALKKCRIVPNLDDGNFVFIPEFYSLEKDLKFRVAIDDTALLETNACNGIPVMANLENIRTWSPESPYLYGIKLEVVNSDGCILDSVKSYAGLRKIHIEGNKLMLNNKPLYFRFVLDQGFYPDGIWTAPSDEALKNDIILSMKAGFNGARLHQKIFEERFHYWADKLGYLTWGESDSWGLCFSNSSSNGNMETGFRNFVSEWREVVDRDANHPSIIVWTPLNETDFAKDWRAHNRFHAELYDLTHQLDPTRPVNDASGYVHVKTDLWTVHNYSQPEKLEEELAIKNGKVWRNYPDNEPKYSGQPYIVDEMGGIKWSPTAKDNPGWGYGNAPESIDEFYKRLETTIEVLLSFEHIAGYCYTQLTDVEQEQNGIYNYDKSEKFDMNKINAIFIKEPE